MNNIQIVIIVGGIIFLYLVFVNRKNIVERFRSIGSSTHILDMYSRDLTGQAKEKKLDPVIGRTIEISRVIQILSRRTKNNPILLGEAGVGKTAIVEGLAQRIVDNEVPQSLRGKRVLAINVSGMIAGTKYRGEFEQRLKKIVDEIRKSERQIILFIDEVHTLLQAEGAEGALDPADILKPALARGELQAIGATTVDEYVQYIKPDESLERRFQSVNVSPPTIKMTIEILRGIASVYEEHHRVEFTLEALKAAAILSDKYIKNRYLPDKAIDLMDEAAAKVRLRMIEVPDQIENIQIGIKELEEKKKKTSNNKKYKAISSKITQNKTKIKELKVVEKKDKENIERPSVTVEDVTKVLSEWVGIDEEKIKEK